MDFWYPFRDHKEDFAGELVQRVDFWLSGLFNTQRRTEPTELGPVRFDCDYLGLPELERSASSHVFSSNRIDRLAGDLIRLHERRL
jgi:predicted component of type VI protein secretion system